MATLWEDPTGRPAERMTRAATMVELRELLSRQEVREQMDSLSQYISDIAEPGTPALP